MPIPALTNSDRVDNPPDEGPPSASDLPSRVFVTDRVVTSDVASASSAGMVCMLLPENDIG